MFQPNQIIKCPYTSKPLTILRVIPCELANGYDYSGWYNLYIVDSDGDTDIVLHTPNNPVEIIE